MQISDFTPYVESGHVRRVEYDGLVLFNYTDKCTYDSEWNDVTTAARGIIFDLATGDIVARPFDKFFNLGEKDHVHLSKLPNEPYVIQEKMDGSLGIIYYYKNKWRVATRGSLTSVQAQWAEERLNCYNLTELRPWGTYLVEIIYPGNKIVVDYCGQEHLVLLGVRHTKEGHYLHHDCLGYLSANTGMPSCPTYGLTIEQAIERKKHLSKDEEGFVVWFEKGLRVKIKGDEYLRIAKIISCLSPLSFWEVMKHGKVPQEYLQQIPEEFRGEWEPMVKAIESKYSEVYAEIEDDLKRLPSREFRDVGIFLKSNKTIKHPSAMFLWLRDNQEGLDQYILKSIRPTANILE